MFKKYFLLSLLLVFSCSFSLISRADTPLLIDSSFVSQSNLSPWLSVWKGKPSSLQDLIQERYFFTLWQPMAEAGVLPSWKTVQLKLNLQNNSDKKQHLLLVLDETWLDKFSLIQVDGQDIRQENTAGNRYGFFDRPIAQGNLVYPVDIKAGGQLSLLIELNGRTDNLAKSLSLWQRNAYFEHTDFALIMRSMYSGVILLFVVFSFLLFIAVREHCYFWFSLLSLSMFIRAVTKFNLPFEYVWPDFPVMQNAVMLSSLLASSALMPLFVSSYLNFAKFRPKLDRIYRAYALLHIPFLFVLAASNWQFSSLFIWIIPTWLFALLMLVNTWQSYKAGSKSAAWFFYSYLIMMILSLTSMINRMLGLNLPDFIDGGYLGELIILIVMSIALSLRIGVKQTKAQVSFAQSRAKNEFLAKMSHEIRTPINGVIGMAQLLNETPLSDKQRHYTDVIQHCSHTLLGVINDILEYGKIEAGKMRLEVRSFRLDELLLKNNELFWPQIQAKNLHYRFYLNPEIPSYFIGDVSRIQQMLNNLFSNAIKFTDTGGIELSIDIELRDDKTAYLVISVEDTGVGMSDDEQRHIFTPFAQGKVTTNRLYGGSGLGLNITRQLAQLMQGSIEFTSEVDEGSCFTLHLPLTIDQPAENAWQQQLAKIHNKQVLLLSERSIHMNPVFQLLETWRVQPICFNDSNDALNYLEQTISSADAILISRNQAAQMTALEKVQWQSYLPQVLIYDESFALQALPLYGFEVAAELCLPYSYLQVQQALFKLLGLREEENAALDAAQQEQEELCRDLCILVAEDDATNRLVIRAILKKLQVQHEIVANGRLAFESYHDAPKKFDLILMDYEMPEMDGCVASNAIRQLEHQQNWPKIPIVGLTAHVLEEQVKRCRESGMDLVLAKPIQIHELIAAFKQFCQAKQCK